MPSRCGNSVGVISIESQSAAVIYAKAASSELSHDNQPRPEGGKVETATPNISNHRQLPARGVPDCVESVLGSRRCSTERQVTGNHIGPTVDYTIRTIRQRNRIAANSV